MKRKLVVAAFAVILGLSTAQTTAEAAPSDDRYSCVVVGPDSAAEVPSLTAEEVQAAKDFYKDMPGVKVKCKKIK